MRLFVIALIAGFLFFQKNSAAHFGNTAPISNEAGDTLECVATEMQELLFIANPARRQRQQTLENQAYQFLRQKQNNGQESALMADYTLPVVFHIIHQNGPENITDAQILTALDNLNDAFSNSNFYDENNGVDTRIEFCLAKRDPNGNATTGINRVVSPLTNVDFSTDIALKNLIRWNPLEYINIWLVRSINGGGVAGYAYFPSSHGGPEDGIVMLGSIMPNLGGGHSTLVHEMGHYLGLYHTFEGGCTNNDCLLDGDRVCDTPPDNSTVSPGNCTATVNSCTTDGQSGFPSDQNDINWNYVDYGNQPCRNGYTQGQADRMFFFVENARQSLLNSPACQNPCLSSILAGFTPSATTVDIGSTVNFANTSTGGTAFTWSANGLQFATTLNANYTFNALGTFEITLDVANADPNCSGTATATIEVTCPISASFTTSSLYPAPGETVSFANTSSGASSYTWTLNGTNVSTAPNFSTDFNSPGQYNICLNAGNGLCSEQFCQLVFVIEEIGNDDCESSFIRRLGDFGFNEESFFLVPDGSGNYFVTGRDGDNSVILQIDPSGNILAQRSYNFTGGSDFVATLMVDSDGFLVGSARDQVNSNTTNILFKLNWTTGTLLWAKRLDNPAYNRFDGLFQHPQTGNYFHYGATSGAIDDYIIEMDQNTGNVSMQFVSDYGGNADVYTSHFLTNNAVYYAGQGRLGANLDDIRPTLTKFDLNGNLQWARIHLRSPNQSSRLYNMDLLVENDTIVNCGRGSLTNDNISLSQLLFYKTSINGNLMWAKSYTITGGTGVAGFQVHAIPGGYIVQGTYDEGGATARMFLARMNKNGNVVWAKKINTATAAAGITKPLTLIDGGFVVFAAQTNQYDSGQNNDILFGKISLDGQVVGAGCELIEDINLVENAISNPYDGALLPDVFTANNAFPNSSFSPLAAELEVNDIPGCECPEPPPGCNETFVTAYGSPANEEGRRIVAVPEGWVFTAAKTDSLIIGLLDPSGHLLWQHSLNISNGLTERARGMALTADGFIVACGSTAEGPLAVWDNFVVKYDYQNQALVWAKRFNFSNGDRSSFVNVTEHPNGNLIISGDSAPNFPPSGLGCDALWMELDASNGNPISIRNFDLGSCETFYQPILSSDGTAWYATGRYNSAGGGTDKFRQPITKLDLNGNQVWTRLYIRNTTSQNARMYGVSVIEDNNGLFVFGQGDLNGSSTANVTLQIFKTDLQGNLLWAKNYDLPGASNENVIKAIAVPDGFLMMGNYSQGDQDIFLLKTDKNGVLQWVKSYGGSADETASDMAYQNGQIFIIGKTNSFGNGGEDMLLMKLDLNGEIQDTNCDFSSSPSSIENNLQNAYQGPHPLTAHSPNYPSVSVAATQRTPPLEASQLCFTPCADTCANGLPIHTMPDAVLQSISGQCNGDSILVSLEVCNADSVALPAATPLSFYQNNPTATAASLLATVLLPNAVAPGACESFLIEIPLPINQQLFAVVNDNGTTPRPFDLSTHFPNTNINECDYTNNMASFTVNFTPLLLNLGPDISTCHFEVVELDAGPGFAAYQWSVPGNNGQTYTAWEPGTYSVTVTDACGGTQVDDITISVVPSSIVEIGVDTAQICAGGSATFSVGGFNSYQWFPPDLVDCSTCPSVVASSLVDTCLIVLAAGSDGCYSADTVCLQITPAPSTFDTLQFCQGETVIIFGNPVSTPGDYFQVFSAQNGCDSTHTITLLEIGDTILIQEQAAICQGDSYLFFGTNVNTAGIYNNYDNTSGCTVHTQLELSLLDTFSIVENISICQGETVDIFGIPISVAGTFQMLFAAQNGCDSTHTIHLFVQDTSATSETITICENEMADIFGNMTNLPGSYSQTFPNSNGCDSTHTIVLVVNDTFLVSETISICQGDSAFIFGNWEKQAGMFSQLSSTVNGCDSMIFVELLVNPNYQISENITICENETADIFGTPTNMAGVYTQSLQTAAGCDSTHTIELTVLDTSMTNETIIICENEMADIFGTMTNQPGIYLQIFPNSNNCDSTHFITLIVNDTVQTTEHISICFGDSAFIFGQWETQPGEYFQAYPMANGCDSTHLVSLSVGSEIGLSFETVAGCGSTEGGEITVTASGGTQPYTYQWSIPGETGSTVTGMPPGFYEVTVTDAGACTSAGTVQLEANLDLDLQITATDASCFGFADGSLTLSANLPDLAYSLDGITFQPGTNWANMPAGNYTLFVQNPDGCEWQFPIAIGEPPQIFVSLPSDITIELGETVTIQANTFQDSLFFTWLPDQWLSCNDCPSPLSSPETTILYTLTAFDQNDCSASDSILVTVEFTPGIYVPNAFSPNGDGINDHFYIQGKGISEVRLLRVFDRWGEMVFESLNATPNEAAFGWDGTFRNKQMNPAVFAFYAELGMLDGSNRVVKGDVTLLR